MSSQEAASGYAYWIAPDGLSRVAYSLGVFHEIDFLVNEGYRRIPHGGVESGGLLFGTADGPNLRIDAFRPIECEHASGPSFVLSPRDIAGLREQLVQAGADPELSGFRPLGWFIAHTRSPLRLNDREAQLFDELFPRPGSLAVLVKPERFEPTRFAFLLRSASGEIERDGASRAIILPLPGRASVPDGGDVASIPAPEKRPAARPVSPASLETGPAPPDLAPPQTPHTPQLHSAPTRIVGRAAPDPTPPPAASPRSVFDQPVQPPREIVPPPAPAALYPAGFSVRPTRPVRELAVPQPRLLGWRFASVLLLAAVLGCVAGYWCYLQLPSPVIPLSLRQQGGRIVVAWPAAQTSSIGYAAVRVNDGDLKPLTPEEKNAGELSLPDNDGDIKIELMAQHWLRDSRGIVRYLKAPRPADTSPGPAR